jgi:phosphatidylserine/phosphatidylglycerophosphate/cardiolipin synthase-like enzyme
MHLKSYQIDGRLLRTGAANFSASGLKRQDNDLIVIESATAAAGAYLDRGGCCGVTRSGDFSKSHYSGFSGSFTMFTSCLA